MTKIIDDEDNYHWYKIYDFNKQRNKIKGEEIIYKMNSIAILPR